MRGWTQNKYFKYCFPLIAYWVYFQCVDLGPIGRVDKKGEG